jgi:zinc transporter
LPLVTTLWLPATFVTGFFGMNTKNLPFADNEYGTSYAGALLRRWRRSFSFVAWV